MNANIIEILKQNRLSVTGSRVKILQLFLDKGNALSHASIEKNTNATFDRVTVYRTLQTFVEKGIIHLIPTTDNSVKYALCKSTCPGRHHHDNHVHFICAKCNKTICLDDVNIPAVALPKGFKPQHTGMIVTGVCKACN
jgi:Fur family ferric uptake transcriptional regulator